MNQTVRHVEETRIGKWFLGTPTWVHYVLEWALRDLREFLPVDNRKYDVVIDVGCGRGLALKYLDELFKPRLLIGIEADSELSQRAQVVAKQCAAQVVIHAQNACAPDLDDNSVDVIFCHQTFHHLEFHEQAIAEFYRILKPGGLLFFAESTRRYIYSWSIRLFFRHPMHVQKTAAEYIALIRSAGFVIEPKKISTPYHWWSREDFGAFEWFGFKPKKNQEPTLVNLLAVKPQH